MAKRYAEAEALRRRFGGCKTMAELAKDGRSARLEDMKFIKPSSIAEPTRSLLLSAKDGDMLPPHHRGAGIEVYAVCGRRPIKVDEKRARARPRRAGSTRNSRSWPSATCATSGRMRTSSIGERRT